MSENEKKGCSFGAWFFVTVVAAIILIAFFSVIGG